MTRSESRFRAVWARIWAHTSQPVSGCDARALRWLTLWASETGTATIAEAAGVTASLADLPSEPSMLRRLLER